MTDPISDMISRVRNALRAKKLSVTVQYSRLKHSVALVMLNEGYIGGVSLRGEKKTELVLTLKYHDTRPVIDGIARVSRPGLRVYKKHSEIPLVRGRLGVVVVSTPEGVLSGHEARRRRLGGELICKLW